MVHVNSLNDYYEAEPYYDRIPPYSGEHYWIQMVAYRVDPSAWDPQGPVILDRENLVQISAVGCFHCEQLWDKTLVKTKCQGEPNA